MTTQSCNPIREQTFCGVELCFHTLRNGRWICPVLNEATGYWIEPPLECVADASVAHDGDDICDECMPNDHNEPRGTA